VRLIRYTVNPATFMRICVRNDELPVNINDL
jgi:hypothetical protein